MSWPAAPFRPDSRPPRLTANSIGMAASYPTHRWNGCSSSRPRRDTLAFQIDLWSAAGELPRDLTQVAVREKEIRYSSRTRSATDRFKNAQKLRIAFAEFLKQLPDDLRKRPDAKRLAEHVDEKVCNIVHLIYRSKSYEGIAKDFEFTRAAMEEHWKAGFEDAVRSLSHPEVLQRPDKLDGVRTFDWPENRTRERCRARKKLKRPQ